MKISWSIISISSRFIAVGIGLIQSLFIIKILSVEDYGIVGLVGAIAGIVGVYQNLGISSGSTREIASANSLKEVFKVFTGSLLVRYLISLPLVVGLFVLAPYLGNVYYSNPLIILPLRIFSVVLFVQALQSVLTSVIQGMKKFKFLFSFQSGIAVVSVAVFLPMLFKFNMLGYFYALLLFNVISTLVLATYAYTLLKGNFEFPKKDELIEIFKAVFSIGIYVYIIKIILVQWQKLGPAVLANEITPEMLGVFTFVLLVASKVSVISDAVTDVTLPSMTKVYTEDKKNFVKIFLKSNSRAYLLILYTALMLIVLKVQLFAFADLLFSFIGKDSITEKYSYAFYIMDPVILGFWGYSHLNLIKSGVAVPTKKMFGALLSFLMMFLFTFIPYHFLNLDPTLKYSVAMGIGGLVGYLSMILFIKIQLSFFPISINDIIYTCLAIIPITLYYIGVSPYFAAILLSIITFLYYKFVLTKSEKVN